MVAASVPAKCPELRGDGDSSSSVLSDRTPSFGVGASTVNIGFCFSNGDDRGVSGLVSGVSFIFALVRLVGSSVGVEGSAPGSCGRGSFSSKTDIGREGFRCLESRSELLLQVWLSPRASLAVDEPEADDLVEKVELRRNSGFSRAARSVMTSFPQLSQSQFCLVFCGGEALHQAG